MYKPFFGHFMHNSDIAATIWQILCNKIKQIPVPKRLIIVGF